MPQKSGKIDEREYSICQRLAAFRRASGWSQPKFAKKVGITLDQLASVEYGRTPLRYGVAFQIWKLFPFSVFWLAVNAGPMFRYTPLPSPKELGVPENSLFSEVYDKVLEDFFADKIKKIGNAFFDFQLDLENRAAVAEIIDEKLSDWVLEISGEALTSFQEAVIEAMEEAGATCGSDRWQLILERRKLRDEFLRLRDISPINRRNEPKKDLIDISLKSKSEPVTEIQRLIKDAKAKASQPGAKSALAKELGVAPARISEWLSGEKEPGGDYALRLDRWVYGPRRK